MFDKVCTPSLKGSVASWTRFLMDKMHFISSNVPSLARFGMPTLLYFYLDLWSFLVFSSFFLFLSLSRFSLAFLFSYYFPSSLISTFIATFLLSLSPFCFSLLFFQILSLETSWKVQLIPYATLWVLLCILQLINKILIICI